MSYRATASHFLVGLILLLSIFSQPLIAEEGALIKMINSEHRMAANKQRDRYRHPEATLDFFAIKPEMTVIEIWPGRGWYTEILAPYIKQGSGTLIAAGFPLNSGPKWRQAIMGDYRAWLASQPDQYDQVKLVELGPPANWSLGANESVDAVLTFRNVHNWVKGGYAAEMFTAFYQVLKPGGILGLTEHRAIPDTDIALMKRSGYITEALVIELAEQAGFTLEARSEINANPKDTKDYPKGVWTLPPTLRLAEQDKAKYQAIGESDRMTLRFRK